MSTLKYKYFNDFRRDMRVAKIHRLSLGPTERASADSTGMMSSQPPWAAFTSERLHWWWGFLKGEPAPP